MSIEKRPKHRAHRKGKESITPIAYRNTAVEWLEEFLTNKIIFPHKDEGYISFSYSVARSEFGKVQIIFDLGKLEEQGAKAVNYDAIEYGHAEPKLTRYVTGREGEEQYYKDLGVEDAEGAHSEYELSWNDFIDMLRDEDELIASKLTYEEGIIRKVLLSRDIYEGRPDIIEILKEHNIPYEVI
jgi:hypothetical protein